MRGIWWKLGTRPSSEISNKLSVFNYVSNGGSNTEASSSSLPGPPGSATASSNYTSSATIMWIDGNLGDPEETYSVNCVASASGSCTDSGVEVTGITRGTQSATVSGLAPNTLYSCWVKASNMAGGLCSSNAVMVTTLNSSPSLPGIPFSLSQGESNHIGVTITWKEGSVGVPQELYSLKRVSYQGSCTDQSVAEQSDISRGIQQGKVTGLLASTLYTCFVIAKNTEGISMFIWTRRGLSIISPMRDETCLFRPYKDVWKYKHKS